MFYENTEKRNHIEKNMHIDMLVKQNIDAQNKGSLWVLEPDVGSMLHHFYFFRRQEVFSPAI